MFLHQTHWFLSATSWAPCLEKMCTLRGPSQWIYRVCFRFRMQGPQLDSDRPDPRVLCKVKMPPCIQTMMSHLASEHRRLSKTIPYHNKRLYSLCDMQPSWLSSFRSYSGEGDLAMHTGTSLPTSKVILWELQHEIHSGAKSNEDKERDSDQRGHYFSRRRRSVSDDAVLWIRDWG